MEVRPEASGTMMDQRGRSATVDLTAAARNPAGAFPGLPPHGIEAPSRMYAK